MTGFEPATLCTQNRCATTALHPEKVLESPVFLAEGLCQQKGDLFLQVLQSF